jgi:hypothetical protein
MPFAIKVDRHKTRAVAINAKFPPLMPDRTGQSSGGSGATFMTSISSSDHMAPPPDLGGSDGGRVLRLEDDGMRFAKSANRLKAAIADIDARAKQVRKGITRARRLRSTFGGQAAAETARRREAAQVNMLEGNLSMWTMRDNDQAAINTSWREKINQLRIQLTALKRVFNEHAADMKRCDVETKELYLEANQIERLRSQARERLGLVVQAHEADDAETCRTIESLDAFIERQREKAMGRIDEVLNMDSNTGAERQSNAAAEAAASAAAAAEESGRKNAKKGAGWAPPKIANETTYVEVHSEKEFQEAFDTVGSALGLTDPLEITETFLSTEANMFELFRETERIHEKIRISRQDLRTVKEASAALHDEQMQANAASAKKLAAMQERIDKIRVKDRYQVNRLAKIRRQFSKIADQMSDCFTSIGCDDMDEPTSSMGSRAGKSLGASSASMRQYLGATVGESNIMKYLGVIESKAIGVVDLYKHSLLREGIDVSAFDQFMPGPSRPHGGVMDRMKIDAPKMDIKFYTHNRGDAVKTREKKLDRVAGPVSPMSRAALMAELKSQEDAKNGKPKKLGSHLLKIATHTAKQADKVIHYH